VLDISPVPKDAEVMFAGRTNYKVPYLDSLYRIQGVLQLLQKAVGFKQESLPGELEKEDEEGMFSFLGCY
jgi:hypothetical protein